MTEPIDMAKAKQLIQEAREAREKRRQGFGAEEATADRRTAELPRGQSAGVAAPVERPQFPGGIDDMEIES